MKTYWGSGGLFPSFLISTLDGNELSASRLGMDGRYGRCGLEKDYLSLLGIKLRQSSP
jgi:hypothetical protein